MEEFNPYKIIAAWGKELRICSWTIFIAYVVIGLLSLLVLDSYIIFFLCTLLFYFLMPRIRTKLYEKHIFSILTTELDPEKYLAIINTPSGAHSHGVHLLKGFLYMGDYQTVLNIVANRSCYEQYKRYMPFYLYTLLMSYFELDDTDKLRNACENLEQSIGGWKINKKTKKRFQKNLDFARCYLDGDLNACKVIVKDMRRTAENNYQKAYSDFREAILAYKSGEKAEATALFENVCSAAPKLGIARISQKYIDAIKDNGEVLLAESEIVPDTSYEYPFQNVPNKKKRVNWAMVAIIVSLILAVIEIFGFIASHLLPLLIQ